MPYIKQDKRKELDVILDQLQDKVIAKGDLTYALYKLCVNYLKGKTINYDLLSLTMSCLEDAKLEWYRRKISVYEDTKIIENGDVM